MNVVEKASWVAKQLRECGFDTKGLPASGKTTWVNDFIRDQPNKWYWLNNDNIRDRLSNMLYSKGTLHWTPSFEKDVKKAFNLQLKEWLDNGFNVILDNTYLNPKTLKSTQEHIKQNWPHVEQEIKDFKAEHSDD